MLIKFNAADEFVKELKKEPLAKPVVRLTYLRKANEKVAPLNSVYIVATAKAADGDIIRLDHYCGALWGVQEDEETHRHAEDINIYIKNHCKDLHLEVRAGLFEEA